jgi:protein-disulfide isomerase
MMNDMSHVEEYQCKYCKGIVKVAIMRDTEKATAPKIEFCPFCGMSNNCPEKKGRRHGNKGNT